MRRNRPNPSDVEDPADPTYDAETQQVVGDADPAFIASSQATESSCLSGFSPLVRGR